MPKCGNNCHTQQGQLNLIETRIVLGTHYIEKNNNTTAQTVPIKQDIFIMKLYNMYSLDGQYCCFSGHDATTSFLYVLRHQMSFFGIMDGKTVRLTVLTVYQACRPWV